MRMRPCGGLVPVYLVARSSTRALLSPSLRRTKDERRIIIGCPICRTMRVITDGDRCTIALVRLRCPFLSYPRDNGQGLNRNSSGVTLLRAIPDRTHEPFDYV